MNRKTVDKEKIRAAVRQLLEGIGEDPDRAARRMLHNYDLAVVAAPVLAAPPAAAGLAAGAGRDGMAGRTAPPDII